MDEGHLEALDELREYSGGPIIVTSGFRCLTHNKAVGGVRNSWHTRGMATDCVPMYISLDEFADLARQLFNEVIQYDAFVHVANKKIK